MRHATEKAYRHFLYLSPVDSPFLSRYAWHIEAPLDLDAIRQGLSHLVGEHDFTSFRGQGCTAISPVRTIFRAGVARHDVGPVLHRRGRRRLPSPHGAQHRRNGGERGEGEAFRGSRGRNPSGARPFRRRDQRPPRPLPLARVVLIYAWFFPIPLGPPLARGKGYEDNRRDRSAACYCCLLPSDHFGTSFHGSRRVEPARHQNLYGGSMAQSARIVSRRPGAVFPILRTGCRATFARIELLRQLRDEVRKRHYSNRTEEAYSDWVVRYLRFHRFRDPRDMGKEEVERFYPISPSKRTSRPLRRTRRSAPSCSLYRDVLGITLDWLDGVVAREAAESSSRSSSHETR